MRAAPLVADPAGDADMQPQVEIGVQFRLFAGEAMRDRLWGMVFFEDFPETRKSIPGMQEKRFLQVDRQFELQDEPFFLVWVR